MAPDLYAKLTGPTEQDRLHAAVALLDRLIKADDPADWDAALARLARALVSPHHAARLGASMALTELLNERYNKISVPQYLALLPAIAPAAGPDDRYAALFGAQALVNSKVFTYKHTSLDHFSQVADRLLALAKPSPASTTAINEAAYVALARLAARVPDAAFPHDDAARYLLQALHTSLAASFTPEGVAVYLALPAPLRVRVGALPDGWACGDPLAKGNFASLAKVLAASIPESASVDQAKESAWKSKKRGAYGHPKPLAQPPKPNMVWEKIALAYLALIHLSAESKPKKHKASKASPAPPEQPIDRVSFDDFWKNAVDNVFFSQAATPQKRLIGFDIFQVFLDVFSTALPSALSLAKTIFSPNLIRVVTTPKVEKSAAALLQRAIKSFAAALVAASRASPALAAVFLETIYASKSAHNFDILTKTKTTQELMALALTPEYLPVLSKFYLDAFISPFPDDPRQEPDSQLVELRRKWALEKLIHLIKSPVLQKSTNIPTEWLDNLLYTLIRLAFFKDAHSPEKKESKKRKHEDSPEDAQFSAPSPPLSQTTVTLAQEKLSSIIGLTVNLKRPDNITWPYRALSKLVKLESNTSLQGLVKFEESDQLIKNKSKALQTLEKIRVKRQSSPHVDGPQLEAFELLFSLVIFQIYTSDTEAGGVLEELQACYNTIQGQSQTDEVVMGKPGSASTSNNEDSDSDSDDDDEVDVSLVLTEILLSFISRESAVLRKVSETVWKTFVPQITRESLQRLYDVLVVDESTDGQSGLFENLDGLEDEMEDEEDEEEEEEEEEEEDESSEDSPKEAEDEEDEETARDKIEQVEEESRRKLAEALGISGNGEATTAKTSKDDSDEDNDDDDESMNDEQMMALDGHLAAIFRERQRALTEHSSQGGPTKRAQRKKEAKAARHNMVQFKTRVLDLLSVYIQAQPSSPLVLTMVLPLLNLIKVTRDKTLGEKAVGLLKKDVCKVKIGAEMAQSIRKDIVFEIEGGGCDDGCCDGPADSHAHSHEMEVDDDSEDDAKSTESKSTAATSDDDDVVYEVATSDLLEWIQETHSLAWKSQRTALTQACNQSSVFLSKALLTADFTCLQAVLSVYMASMHDWLSSRQNKLAPAMFNDFLNWAYSFRQQKFGAAPDPQPNGNDAAPQNISKQQKKNRSRKK